MLTSTLLRWLRWLRLPVSLGRVYRVHRARVRLFLCLVVLSRAWRAFVRNWVLQVHQRVAAELPKLYYQPTLENARVLEQCPTLTQHKYHPPLHLFNGHLQTLQLTRDEARRDPVVKYERQTLDMPDGGILSLDWALPPRPDRSIPRVSELDRTRRTMLVIPGLTGGSGDFYVRCQVHHMVKQLGWQVVVMNARGCADTPVKTPQFYCAAYTDDLRFVIQYLETIYRFHADGDAFVAVGFSMGGNILVKYLGEETQQPTAPRRLLTAAVSVGNPWNLAECSRKVTSTLFRRLTYNKVLGHNSKRLFFELSNAHEVFQDHPELDHDAARAADSIGDYDSYVTCRLFGYADPQAYYHDASSAHYLVHVRLPLLCVNATDDPISTKSAIPTDEAMQNPQVILATTERGGHLAFYEETPDHKPRVWSVRAVAEYAQAHRQKE